jgi:hypothetical protein
LFFDGIFAKEMAMLQYTTLKAQKLSSQDLLFLNLMGNLIVKASDHAQSSFNDSTTNFDIH